MEHCSALKRKEILTLATAWMNPEAVTLREVSQSQKDKHHPGVHLSEVPRGAEFIGTKSRMVGANAVGEERGGMKAFKGTKLQTGKMKRVLGMAGATVV